MGYNYDEVFAEAKKVFGVKDPLYGSHWKFWEITAIISIAEAKLRRVMILHKAGLTEEALDEGLDVLNYTNFAMQKLSGK